jgi:transcriptional regulator with GAF, ATPase, and Fis domain
MLDATGSLKPTSRPGTFASEPALRLTTESDPGTLAALVEVSGALSGTLDLKTALDAALEVLRHHQGILRSTVTLLDAQTEDLRVEAGLGLSCDERSARYRIGEGVTGRVVQTGKPMVVPRSSEEPLFLHRAGAREPSEETSFICVPIPIGGRSAGALAVDLRHEIERDYDSTVALLAVTAAMIGQATRVSRLVEAERRRLERDRSAVTERSLGSLVAAFERDLIEDTLKTAGGSRAKAARLLNTTERILGYRIRRYGIDCRPFRR